MFFSTSSSSIVQQLRWRLERVRIVCSLESEFDKKKHGVYYVEGLGADNQPGLFVLVRELIDGRVPSKKEAQESIVEA